MSHQGFKVDGGGTELDITFEPVYEVVDDFHGPRSGFAEFRGQPHRFCAIGWQDENARGASGFDPRENRFYLTPTSDPDGNRVFATAIFRTRRQMHDMRGTLEVRWEPYGCLIRKGPDPSTLEAIRRDPRYAQAYLSRGVAWQSKGEHDKAITAFEEVISVDPRNARAYQGRGRSWREKGECEKAAADFEEAARLDAKLAAPD